MQPTPPLRSIQPPLLLGDDGDAVIGADARPFALPTGTVTFLLTDVEGSTKQWEAVPDAMAAAIALHYEILDEAISAAGGVRPVEQGEGDSVVGAFSRASDAIAAAASAQRALHDAAWPTGCALGVRMAVHTGEAQLRDEGNYFGQAIIRCARLRSCGWGGQVLMSQTSADLVRDHLGDDVTLVDLGRHRLKDLQQPEQVWQLEIAGLRQEFPALASLDAFRHNLPIQVTPLVGRERELRELSGLLAEERIITLTGSGGCGKTRLASELAARVVDRFGGGVTWVELGPCGDIGAALGVLMSLLGASEGTHRPFVDQVVDRLDRRGALLLVLDNAEHLLTGVAEIVAAIGARSPEVRVVTTSREPLGVPGEVVWRVPSLTSPPPDRGPIALAALDQFEAVQLFIDRARRARRGFTITDDTAPAVASICSRLDGVPLAIELAAARVRTMSPDRIAAQLDDRFRLLAGGPRTALPRQQTLQASIAWSEELLDATERTVFARLGVFVGGFTVEAAEAVVAAFGDVDPYEAADVVARLADKSLLHHDEAHDRYSMLESIRSYALQRLMEAGETGAARDHHASWCADWLERERGHVGEATSVHDWWERRVPSFARIGREHANCLAALDWLPAGCVTALRIVAGIGEYWTYRNRSVESGTYGMTVVAEGDDTDPAWLRALVAIQGARKNDFDDRFEQFRALGSQRARDAGDRSAQLHLDGLPAAELLRRGPTPDITAAAASSALEAAEIGEWYVAFNASQMLANNLGMLGRVSEAEDWLMRVRVPGSRPLMIRSGGDLLRGTFEDAVDRLRLAAQAIDRGDAPSGDEALLRFRMAALTLATGRLDWFDELSKCLPPPTGGGSSAYDAVMGAFHVLDDLLRGDLVAARRRLVGRNTDAFFVVRYQVYLPPLDLALDDAVAARAHALELRDRCADVDAPLVDAVVDLVLAECAWPDDLDGAMAAAHRSLARAAEFGLWPSVVDALEAIGAMTIAGGRQRSGARLLAAAQSGRDAMGYVHRFAHRARYLDEVRDAAQGDDGWEEGATLTLSDAVDLARRTRGERVRPSVGWQSLTPTEQAVVEQVAAGLTNPQIAERLLMGRSTVKTHLLHVFTKLGLSTRAELIAIALRQEASSGDEPVR